MVGAFVGAIAIVVRAKQPTVKLAVLGGGRWGTALADLARHNGHTVAVWSRHGEVPLATALADSAILLSAVSMAGVQPTIARLQALPLPERAILVTATKGLDAQTGRTPSQLWQAALPDRAIVVLSGPNLSKEIAAGLPAATVAASTDPQAAAFVQGVFASVRFRVYTNADPLGVELGGTLKNVIAIAVGVCDGLHLGANAKAALITRALPEIVRVGTHFGAQPETFWGLSGLGDLLATCTSALSRNYQVGWGLAQGRSLGEILATLEGTAEGINTTYAVTDLADRAGLSVPIARCVRAILDGQLTPLQAVDRLMERELKSEVLG